MDQVSPVYPFAGGILGLLAFLWRIYLWIDRRTSVELKRQDAETDSLRREVEAERRARYAAENRANRAEGLLIRNGISVPDETKASVPE